jgi:hypothetical protein
MSELMLDVGQAKEIKDALRRERGSDGSEWTNEKVKALTERRGLFGQVLDILDGRLKVATIEAVPDTLIRITRPVKPAYPDWVKKVMHDELEDVGPGEYGLATIDPWLQ